jgi:ABC-2 type transport system ATP-binding protein
VRPPLLEVDAADKAFGANTALAHVSLAVRPGERVALLGRNGAGKSTLVRSVGGLVRLDRGTVRVDGADVARSRRPLARVGFSLEGARNVYWRLTPWENARYFARIRGVEPAPARLEELLDAFAIPRARDQEVGKLSTGNKQKVAIVCALVHDPALLLLDEPTLGLDAEAVARLRSFIARHAAAHGRAFVITSHDLGFVEDVCERAIVLDGGRVVYDGSLAALRARASGYQIRAEVARGEERVKLAVDAAAPTDVFAAIAALAGEYGARVLDVDVGKAPLATAYLDLTRGVHA